MNVLALDFGLKRIGVAVGSTESGIAFAREILLNDAVLFQSLDKLLKKEHIQKIVLGTPLKRDGSEGDIDTELSMFLKSLEMFDLPVELMDERYTSKMARIKMKDLHLRKTERKDPIDSFAAQILLQEWLESH